MNLMQCNAQSNRIKHILGNSFENHWACVIEPLFWAQKNKQTITRKYIDFYDKFEKEAEKTPSNCSAEN